MPRQHPKQNNEIDSIGTLDSELQEEWAVWRLVTERVATLKEINEHYTYTDILKANAILDMQQSVKAYYQEKASKKRN